jgi:hypothetical protein
MVPKGTREALLRRERSRFLKGEWPTLRALPDLAEEK